MPPFVIGVERAIGFGDYGSRSGEIPVDSDLAWAARDGMTAAGFDLALSFSLTIDHGLVQAYDMLITDQNMPIVPLVVNTIAPPLPTVDRCTRLGHALGAALRHDGTSTRVLVVASGGLSHWLPSNDPRDPGIDPRRRDSIIYGRADVKAFAAAREPGVRSMGGTPDAPVNVEWDRDFLRRMHQEGGVPSMDDVELEKCAGNGGNEIRTWMIGRAAAGQPLVWSAYDPVPEWITGMGIGATFPIAG
jgi:2,3-dihydroxyphenylpropionate 1,2-dioxygenase